MHGYKRKSNARETIDASREIPGVKSNRGTGTPIGDMFRSGEERGEAALIGIIHKVREYLWFRAKTFNFQQLELMGGATPQDHHDAAGNVSGLRSAADRLDELLSAAGFVHVPRARNTWKMNPHSSFRCSEDALIRLELIDRISEDANADPAFKRFFGENSIYGVRLFDHDLVHLAAWIPLVTALYGKRARDEGLELDRLTIDREAAEKYSGRGFEDLINRIWPAG